jgi:hypothetical protein
MIYYIRLIIREKHFMSFLLHHSRTALLCLMLLIGSFARSTGSVLAASPGCTAVNGRNGISLLGSSSFSADFIAGEKIFITLTTDPAVSWSITLSQPGSLVDSGMRTGNGTFNITVPRTSAGTVDITGYDFNPPGVGYTITCTGLPPVPGTSVEEPRAAPPPIELWEGAPNSVAGNYDGRINATRADRYAVYCKAGELQVWDGVVGQKVGRMSYTQLAQLANPVSVAIGTNVFLGRSNNELAVVIPGVFEKFGIPLDKCINGDYDIRR